MATLFDGTITAAGTVISGTVTNLHNKHVVGLGAVFAYGSGGGTATAYVQTSFDDGATWQDVASFAFTNSSAQRAVTLGWPVQGTAHYTVSDGTLTGNSLSGAVVGDAARVKVISTGTYAGTTTLRVDAALKRR